MLILVAEKDLGGATIFMMIFIMMIYLATQKTMILIGGLGGAAVIATVGYSLLKDKFSHVTTRINAWLDPFPILMTPDIRFASHYLRSDRAGWKEEVWVKGFQQQFR